MISNNPQMKQAWDVSQNILKGNGSNDEKLKQACQKSGIDENKAKEMLKNFGINI